MEKLPETYVAGFHDEAKVRKMKYSEFGNTGLKVSQLAIGTGGFCLAYGEFTLEECKATLHEAIKSGINYIDTAPYYGSGVSEEVLGKCLKGIPRKAYYIATKVGRYEQDPKLMFDFTSKKTKRSIDTSLKRLGLDYVDILQVHDIEFAPTLDVVFKETLPTVKEAKNAGKCRFIGVTGYPVSVLAECVQESQISIDMVLSYTRLSLLDNTLKKYLPIFQQKKLGIVNAAPHCLGLLSNAGPQPWHVAGEEIKKVCGEARNYCQSKGVELGKLAIHYSLNQPGPHTHLVGMNTRNLLTTNLEVYYNGLTSAEKEVEQYITSKIFSKLKQTHWEETEVAEIRKIMSQ